MDKEKYIMLTGGLLAVVVLVLRLVHGPDSFARPQR